MASPAPKSPEQSEKSKKYDRQLRLWGDHGQTALESAKICLINATPLGTEILKSLVLPGVGSFTIVDGKEVTEEDVGNNFFLDLDSVGQSRAKITTQLLLELNPDVKGDFVDETLEQLLEKNPTYFNNFTVVIAVSVPERTMITLSKSLWSSNIPLIAAQSCGLIGYFRIQLKEHVITESHPDTQNPDLRLDFPFPGLQNHVDSYDLNKMDLKEHSHIPYIIPLLKCLQQWRTEHNGCLPKNFKDKESLRNKLRKAIKLNDEGIPEQEENFEEAMRAVNFAAAPTAIPVSVQNIFNDNCCTNLTAKSDPFWILAKAIKDYVDNEGHGYLPLRGSLPDMTSDTNNYIKLQKIYQQEFLKCVDIVHRRAQQLLHQLALPLESITESDSKMFCKHAFDLFVIRSSCIADEYDIKLINTSYITQHLENPDSLMVYYVMFRGINRFFDEYNRYPGEFGDETDIVKLKCSINKLLNEWSCLTLSKDDYIHEVCRYGGSELHSTSAFLGALIAHEVIKLVTNQYVPVSNTFLYDAITSTTETFTF